MTDHPIIFSAPMVLALLASRKTMTRRLAWAKRKQKNPIRVRGDDERAPAYAQASSPWQRVAVGDRLYVRENFWRFGRWIGTKKAGNPSYSFAPCARPGGNLIFVADFDNGHPLPMGQFGSYDPAWHIRPNIFLPREESRLTLIVTATKIERLQEISQSDAQAEGVAKEFRTVIAHPRGFKNYSIPASYRGGFVNIWNKLHADGAHEWEDNPEVVCLTFRVILANIDAPEALVE